MVPAGKPTFDIAVVKGTIVNIDRKKSPVIKAPPQIIVEKSCETVVGKGWKFDDELISGHYISGGHYLEPEWAVGACNKAELCQYEFVEGLAVDLEVALLEKGSGC